MKHLFTYLFVNLGYLSWLSVRPEVLWRQLALIEAKNGERVGNRRATTCTQMEENRKNFIPYFNMDLFGSDSGDNWTNSKGFDAED